jgi:hypothetical protein
MASIWLAQVRNMMDSSSCRRRRIWGYSFVAYLLYQIFKSRGPKMYTRVMSLTYEQASTNRILWTDDNDSKVERDFVACLLQVPNLEFARYRRAGLKWKVHLVRWTSVLQTSRLGGGIALEGRYGSPPFISPKDGKCFLLHVCLPDVCCWGTGNLDGGF